MALNELHSLLLIFTIAAVAPLLCEWVPRIRLPLVVAEIGLSQETAASLVGAGMASVLLFPIAALALRRTAVLRQHARTEVAMPDKIA